MGPGYPWPAGGRRGRRTRDRLESEGASSCGSAGVPDGWCCSLSTRTGGRCPAAPALAQGGSAQTPGGPQGPRRRRAGRDRGQRRHLRRSRARSTARSTGSVVAFHGPVTVSGTVNGSVISVSNRVVLLGGAVVDGDVQLAEDRGHRARRDGRRNRRHRGLLEVDSGRPGQPLPLVVRRDRLDVRARARASCSCPRRAHERHPGAATRVGPSIGWGGLAFFGLPIAAVILLVIVDHAAARSGAAVRTGAAVPRRVRRLGLGARADASCNGRPRSSPSSSAGASCAGGRADPDPGGAAWTLATIFGLGALAVAVWSKRPGAGTATAVPRDRRPPRRPRAPPPPA